MLWVLWDIVLPLVVTFLLGVLLGWLLWRWRRKRLDAEGLSELRRASSRYRADAERLQQSNMELSDRLRASADCSRQVKQLNHELEAARLQLTTKANSAGLAQAQQTIEALQQQLAESRLDMNSAVQPGSELSGLSKEIEARDNMIATLQMSLQQFGEHGDNTSLLADIALRDRRIAELEAQLKNP